MKKVVLNAMCATVLIIMVCGCQMLNKMMENNTELLSKKEEFSKFSASNSTPTTQKVKPKIKGKVLIVKTETDGLVEFDRFNKDGKFVDAPVAQFSNFYPAEVYAKKLDEIDTLIKIQCREHKGSETYTVKDSSELIEFVNTICVISIIDYKTKTLLAGKQSGSELPPESVRIKKGEVATDKEAIIKEVSDYLSGCPLELLPKPKATPAGETLVVKEILESFKKSKDSLNQHQNKAVNLTGVGEFNEFGNFITIKSEDDYLGYETVLCRVESTDLVDLAEIEAGKKYKVTVVGNLKVASKLELEKCRLVSAETFKSATEKAMEDAINKIKEK